MVRPRLTYVCELCGTTHGSETEAQMCETADTERMAEISMRVNRWVVCSNPNCERSRRPLMRSEWVPKTVEDRPWRGFSCQGCGSPVVEYIRRDSRAETPELDRAMAAETAGEASIVGPDGPVFPDRGSPGVRDLPPPPRSRRDARRPVYRPGGMVRDLDDE